MAMRPRGGAGAGPNRPGRTTTVRPVYETFTPVFQRQQDEEAEKLIIYLPGFSKENIKVSTEGKTTLKVRGERLIGNNKWNRFLEEFQAPEDCNMRGIHARFENGILTITMPIPKKIPPPVTTTNTQQEETTTLQKQPYIPPFLRTKDDHSPPLLAPQTTPQDTQNQPPKVDENISQKETTPPPPPKEVFQQKPLNAASDDGFADKTSQFRDEKRMEGQLIAAKPPNQDDDDFGAYKSLLHSVERQKKKPVGPMFPKDYEDESPPPSPSVLAAAKHGDQKSLEGQEKVTTGGGQKIGLKDFVEGEKISSEVKAKGTITQPLFDDDDDDDDDGRNKTTTAGVDQSVKQTSMTTSGGGGGDFRLGKAAVSDPKEERQLLVNAGVAVLVILALGAYIYNTVGTRKSD
ncbi:inactive protein RESTRICTED TEV MOVEMENT 2-like [Ipomoea triloba]|uniref:inactive protein RESTRICTED TEV MOVEMENT 2-like n=1 Tax=Ipomoea triloba TaxID=35885 RepID=UPI00125E861E|nr:inactive protein RESTRICTED TEV MOVEMENT 2-like [Ipomoea triloba]